MNKRIYSKSVCPVCGTIHRKRGKTCSNKCANYLRRETNKTLPLKCAICGELFTVKGGKGKYCNNPHYKKCEVCGNNFEIKRGTETSQKITCNSSCASKLSHRSPGNKEKRRANSLAKWGVENPFQAPEVKEKIEKSLEGTAGRFGTEASKKSIRKIYGVENASQLEFVKEKKARSFKKNFIDKGIYPKSGPISKINLEWKQKLETFTGTEWELEKYFKNIGCIDLHTMIKGVQIIVEINPTATHNYYSNIIACTRAKCTIFPCLKHALKEDYHYIKTKTMRVEHGLLLLNVFDWDNEDTFYETIKHVVETKNLANEYIRFKQPNKYLSKGKVTLPLPEVKENFDKLIVEGFKPIADSGLTLNDILNTRASKD